MRHQLDDSGLPGNQVVGAAATAGKGRALALAFLSALAFCAAQPASARTEKVLYSFSGQADGSEPVAGLVLDAQGNLYGTTLSGGGTSNTGTVFRVTARGAEKVLHSFGQGTDGALPFDALIRDAQGNLYGTTNQGGTANSGTVFKVAPNGKETLLYNFAGGTDGQFPFDSLIQDAQGNFYGVTYQGGAADAGTLFKLTPKGQETILYSFTGGSDGAGPYGGLMRGARGIIYGTTYAGGAFNFGTVFKLGAGGKEGVLYSFMGGTDGESPECVLIQDAQGNLYGTTQTGGAHGKGVVFRVTLKGKEKVVYSFTGGVDGGFPVAGLIRDVAGNFYGTTKIGGIHGFGTVFEITLAGTEKVLYSFKGSPDGANPIGGVVRDATGNFYGTTSAGGTLGHGTVFRLTP